MYEEFFIDRSSDELVHRVDGEEVERRPATPEELYVPPVEDNTN